MEGLERVGRAENTKYNTCEFLRHGIKHYGSEWETQISFKASNGPNHLWSWHLIGWSSLFGWLAGLVLPTFGTGPGHWKARARYHSVAIPPLNSTWTRTIQISQTGLKIS